MRERTFYKMSAAALFNHGKASLAVSAAIIEPTFVRSNMFPFSLLSSLEVGSFGSRLSAIPSRRLI